MNDETLSLILRARDEMSGTIRNAGRSLDELKRKSGLANDVISGIGTGVGIAGVLSLQGAIGTTVDLMKDMVQGAADDERSQAQLVQSMMNNVPDWRTHEGAIRDSITAAQDLGFADDGARDALGRLMGRTKDADAAMLGLKTAMELARGRGMDLITAADLVGKAWDGQGDALGRYGVKIDGTKDKEAALMDIMKIFAGQAETYRNTTLGKLEYAQEKVNDAMDKLGAGILPGVAEMLTTVADNIDPLLTELDKLAGWFEKNKGTVELMLVLGGVATGHLELAGAGIAMGWANMNDPNSIAPIEDLLGMRKPNPLVPSATTPRPLVAQGGQVPGLALNSTVHTTVKLDGRAIADIVDKYLGAKYSLGRGRYQS